LVACAWPTPIWPILMRGGRARPAPSSPRARGPHRGAARRPPPRRITARRLGLGIAFPLGLAGPGPSERASRSRHTRDRCRARPVPESNRSVEPFSHSPASHRLSADRDSGNTMPAGTTNLGVAPVARAARTVLVPRRLSGDHAMLRLLGNSRWLCRGATRRDLLHIGGLGAFGFVLADDLGLRAQARPTGQGPAFGRARSCILLYKYGSPAQHETFDPKPEAPAEVQGELGAIPTSVPGVRIGDHLPRIARIMDRLTVVRSLTHPYPLHGTVYATTGIPEVDTRI